MGKSDVGAAVTWAKEGKCGHLNVLMCVWADIICWLGPNVRDQNIWQFWICGDFVWYPWGPLLFSWKLHLIMCRTQCCSQVRVTWKSSNYSDCFCSTPVFAEAERACQAFDALCLQYQNSSYFAMYCTNLFGWKHRRCYIGLWHQFKENKNIRNHLSIKCTNKTDWKTGSKTNIANNILTYFP